MLMSKSGRHALAQTDQLYVRWRGKVSGPCGRDDVLRQFRQGHLSKHHEVSTDQIQWRPLGQTELLHVEGGASVAEYGGGRMHVRAAPQTAAREADSVSAGFPADGMRTAVDAGVSPELPQGIYVPPLSAVDSTGAENTQLIGATQFHSTFAWPILGFGLVPLVILFLQSFGGIRFAHMAWLFSAYFCALWAWLLGSLMTYRAEIWRQGLLFALFTAFIGISMLFIWHQIPLIALLYSGINTLNPLARLAGFVLGVGVFEELCKIAPILLFGLRVSTLKSAPDGFLLGALSGLGFAMYEGVSYTMKYWTKAADISAISIQQCIEQATSWQGVIDRDVLAARLSEVLPSLVEVNGFFLVVQLVRFMVLPLLHASWAGLVGFCVARAFIEGKWGVFVVGFAAAALLHGLYDFVPGMYAILIAGASILVAIAVPLRYIRVQEAQSYAC